MVRPIKLPASEMEMLIQSAQELMGAKCKKALKNGTTQSLFAVVLTKSAL